MELFHVFHEPCYLLGRKRYADEVAVLYLPSACLYLQFQHRLLQEGGVYPYMHSLVVVEDELVQLWGEQAQQQAQPQ
jgi:hypothetical protein